MTPIHERRFRRSFTGALLALGFAACLSVESRDTPASEGPPHADQEELPPVGTWPWPHIEASLTSPARVDGDCPRLHEGALALLRLANHQYGPSHNRVFEIVVYADRCYRFLGHRGEIVAYGQLEASIVQRIARDAYTFGFADFPDDVRHYRSDPGVQLTIRCFEGPRTVRFNPLRHPIHIHEMRRGDEAKVEQAAVCHLLAQRLCDVADRRPAQVRDPR